RGVSPAPSGAGRPLQWHQSLSGPPPRATGLPGEHHGPGYHARRLDLPIGPGPADQPAGAYQLRRQRRLQPALLRPGDAQSRLPPPPLSCGGAPRRPPSPAAPFSPTPGVLFAFVAARPPPPFGAVVSFAGITDGLSQTAAFSERVKGIGTGNRLDPLRPTSAV